MNLDGILSENRSTIIKKWQEAIIQTYPKETQKFLKKEKSQFANPVGSIITKDVEVLFDEVVKGEDTEKIFSSLDKIIRIRAVQDFKPSHAVGFVLQLKGILRETLGEGYPAELRMFDDRVDAIALLAFDVYSQCRRQLCDIRVKEVRNEVGRLLERANLIREIPE
ncbi:MAG: RsbRD N-terminal domain-containing protein [Deltaproteobacteria bacterium]|nr:RsbRD N-terminal domain-containing protein [Deltaproteobacteria bacterium]